MLKESVLYGLHGTLVDVTGIGYLLEENDRDAFYAASLHCPPVHSTVLNAQWAHGAGYENLIFTRMPNTYEKPLRDWLDAHHVPVTHIEMRDPEDNRPDEVVKREMYLAALSAGYRIVRAWSSSPVCLALMRLQGVPVVRVPGWPFV